MRGELQGVLHVLDRQAAVRYARAQIRQLLVPGPRLRARVHLKLSGTRLYDSSDRQGTLQAAEPAIMRFLLARLWQVVVDKGQLA